MHYFGPLFSILSWRLRYASKLSTCFTLPPLMTHASFATAWTKNWSWETQITAPWNYWTLSASAATLSRSRLLVGSSSTKIKSPLFMGFVMMLSRKSVQLALGFYIATAFVIIVVVVPVVVCSWDLSTLSPLYSPFVTRVLHRVEFSKLDCKSWSYSFTMIAHVVMFVGFGCYIAYWWTNKILRFSHSLHQVNLLHLVIDLFGVLARNDNVVRINCNIFIMSFAIPHPNIIECLASSPA